MGVNSETHHSLHQLIVTLICGLLSSCEDYKSELSHESLKLAPDQVNILNLSYDPFTISSDTEEQANIFSGILLDKGNSYALPGQISHDTLVELFLAIKKGYSLENRVVSPLIKRQYHNFQHAMDVFITTHLLLQGGGGIFLSDNEKTALLIAALGHDALHTGVFNSFLIRSSHKYAFEDGNDSIQEKRSFKFLLRTLDSLQILSSGETTNESDHQTLENCRKLIAESILWTDMARHKEQMKAVQEIAPFVLKKLQKARNNSKDAGNSLGASAEDIKNNLDLSSQLPIKIRHLLAGFILHSADVSNLGKPWEISEKWAFLVCSEFFTQGDLERELNMKVSMNCDRANTSIPQSQLNFGKYVIEDIYSLLAKIIYDGGSEILKNFNSNQKKWAELLSMEKTKGVPYQFVESQM